MDFCFAAERMLGRLAKWLRILGFDTLYEPEPGAFQLGASDRNRIILTRRINRRQMRPENRLVVIRSDRYTDQLAELINATGMTLEAVHPFSRCIRCNRPIISLIKAEVRGAVPDYVWETSDVFKTCVGCQRIYWRGSHFENSLEKIRRLFSEAGATQ